MLVPFWVCRRRIRGAVLDLPGPMYAARIHPELSTPTELVRPMHGHGHRLSGRIIDSARRDLEEVSFGIRQDQSVDNEEEIIQSPTSGDVVLKRTARGEEEMCHRRHKHQGNEDEDTS